MSKRLAFKCTVAGLAVGILAAWGCGSDTSNLLAGKDASVDSPIGPPSDGTGPEDATQADSPMDGPADASSELTELTPLDGSGEAGACSMCGGFCVDLTKDPDNCGGCGNQCSLAHAASTCAGGSCTITSCSAGYADCDGIASNGCEADLALPAHCGGCNTTCTGGNFLCASSLCVSRCPTRAPTVCAGACIDTNNDANNCGRCNNPCNLMVQPYSYTYCNYGTCTSPMCAGRTVICSPAGGCENLNDSPANCGRCGNVCPPASICWAGVCCPLGQMNCGNNTCSCPAQPSNGALACSAGYCVAKRNNPSLPNLCGSGTTAVCQGEACGTKTFIVVHASPSLPAVRLCWAVGDPSVITKDAPFPSSAPMPASNYAGIPQGGAVWLDAPQSANAMSLAATLYAVDALNVAKTDGFNVTTSPRTCDQLICPSCSIYWPIGTLAAGTVGDGQANVIAIEGCLGLAADPTANAAHCGSTWDPVNGNLHLLPLALANAHSDLDAGLLSVQAAQLSPGLAALVGDAGSALVTYGPNLGKDSGAPFASLTAEGTVSPQTATGLDASSGLSDFGALGFAVDVQGIDAGSAGHLWMSLAQSQALVDPRQDPRVYFGASGTYVVAIIGDPNATHAFDLSADAGYNGAGLHVLVLPSPWP